jgi:hypothetical protein
MTHLMFDRLVSDRRERSVDLENDSILSTEELEGDLESSLAKFEEWTTVEPWVGHEMLLHLSWRIGARRRCSRSARR